jgi:hypothetical protein
MGTEGMITDEQLHELERMVRACLPDPLTRLSERGCEPPFEMRLIDEEGHAGR